MCVCVIGCVCVCVILVGCGKARLTLLQVWSRMAPWAVYVAASVLLPFVDGHRWACLMGEPLE